MTTPLRGRPTVGGFRPTRPALHSASGLWAYEGALARAGFAQVAGADEAGRGACAGPLVVAACILSPSLRTRLDGLTDSKLLTAAARERYYEILVRWAVSWSVVVISHEEVDAYGLHVANLAGMRRAVGQLDVAPSYVLTDGFSVPGLPAPTTAVWKGDAVAACIAAASVLAKVTRDRIMGELHERWPEYDFARHKGYVTAEHAAALGEHGPSPVHRRRYVNVRRATRTGADGRWADLPTGAAGDGLSAGAVAPGPDGYPVVADTYEEPGRSWAAGKVVDVESADVR
ncbi:MAG: ribonuclease HII [bacterium]